MAEKNHEYSLKILDVCRIAPVPDSSSSSSSSSLIPYTLPLTFFDLLLLRYPPIQRLFFYETETTFSIFHKIILPNLKHSLSLILQHYLPLSGNLIWPHNSHKPIIQFVEGDSVLLTVAESDDADFHYLSGDGFREVVTSYHPLIPELSASHDRVSAISLQVTRFQNSGFSIGISSHHAVLDGTTLFSFINSWARVCNLHVNESSSSSSSSSSASSIDPMTMPFYDRTTIKDPAHLEAIYLNAWLNMDGPDNKSLSLWPFKTSPDLVRCSLELNGQTLKKLKQWVLNKREKTQKAFHLSSFTVTCAYLWVCVAKSESLRDQKRVLVFPVNARSRLEPPLPSNYFGNCIVSRDSCVEGNELMGENGMMVAIEAISEAIKSLEQGVLKGAENLGSNRNSVNISERRTIIGGSPRFDAYNADFGWGKPKKVDAAISIGAGIFYLTENKDGDGGIEIELAGKINELESFTAVFAQGLEAHLI